VTNIYSLIGFVKQAPFFTALAQGRYHKRH